MVIGNCSNYTIYLTYEVPSSFLRLLPTPGSVSVAWPTASVRSRSVAYGQSPLARQRLSLPE
ncbi:MAG: hypothetical protein F6K26_21475 [Moorea sp. SIO2I5]|nr:hypothetical protein [Moorena sp. SIO2I5]